MQLIWILLLATAVAAPLALADNSGNDVDSMLIDNFHTEDALGIDGGKIRDVLQKIKDLISKHKETGKAALLKFLNSDLLERIVSKLPEKIQQIVRAKIERLRDRLTSGDKLAAFMSEDLPAIDAEKVQQLVQKIRDLIDKNKEAGKAALHKFLHSEQLERLVIQLPGMLQSYIRDKIQELKDGLTSDD